uniref:uncharacterized protein At2g39920-like n=1 Tax=Erigeron canadensis TaxID=72917 RepID=UPI001CB968E6|nr:uncharacterized protein At2g39920-like [Erigeron canadensis]
MSAYGHEMEREYSASLSSGEESDMGSEFRMESVIYMSSFAATVFVGALVTVGVLLMTSIISLVVMLQSCQSKSSGTIEMSKSVDEYYSDRYEYCRTGYLHAELNNFELYSVPEICKDVILKYIKDGHYMRELSIVVSTIEDYFKNVAPNVGGADVVLMDIDDLLIHGFHHNGRHGSGVKEAEHLKHVFLLQIYSKLRSGGWSLVLCSREHEKQRSVIIDKLIAARCEGWSKLIMRSDEDMKKDTREYFSKQKAMVQANGYNIRAVISSRMDILVGPFIRTQLFKLPNPFMTLEEES